jgi:hypothetical protein
MRSTIHVVSRRDYWPFAVAIRAPQRDWWLRTQATARGARARTSGREARALMVEGPRRQEELVEVVGQLGMVGPWLDLVRVPPSGTGKSRRAHLFQTAERWSGRRTSIRLRHSTTSFAATRRVWSRVPR